MFRSRGRNLRQLWGALAFSFFLLGVLEGGSAQTDWKSEWDKTVAAAKKEGRVNLYIGRYELAPPL